MTFLEVTVSRSVSLMLMIFAGAIAEGRECVAPADETERLACLEAAASCAAISEASERLICFDTVFASPQTVTSASSSDLSSDDNTALRSDPREPVPSVAEIRPRRAARDAQPEPEDFVEASIVEVARNRNDINFLFLDNGQVWRETEKTRVRFEAGQSVRIESGIFGSRNLTVNGGKRIVKVRRVQ